MQALSQVELGEIIRRLIDALHPREIYLFGSAAEGNADRHSDLDLLVVVDGTGAADRELARRGRRSLWGMAIPVDLIVCTNAEMQKWANVSCNLLHTVREKGKRVYDAAGRTHPGMACES